MATLKEITIQLKSFQNTRKITKTMYMIAASKVRKPIEKINVFREYISVLEDVIHSLSKEGEKNFLLQKGKGSRTALVVVTSDMGLCGGFNHNVIRMAREYLDKNHDKTYDLYGVGKKAKNLLLSRHYDIKLNEHQQKNNVFKKIDGLQEFGLSFIDGIIDRIFANDYEEVVIIHNRYDSMIKQTPYQRSFLPLHLHNRQKDGTKEDTSFLVEGESEDVLKHALREYIRSYFYLILLNSYIGENAARMVAMDMAVNNADNLIQEFTLKKNTLRQTKVTTEMSEIISGSQGV